MAPGPRLAVGVASSIAMLPPTCPTTATTTSFDPKKLILNSEYGGHQLHGQRQEPQRPRQQQWPVHVEICMGTPWWLLPSASLSSSSQAWPARRPGARERDDVTERQQQQLKGRTAAAGGGTRRGGGGRRRVVRFCDSIEIREFVVPVPCAAAERVFVGEERRAVPCNEHCPSPRRHHLSSSPAVDRERISPAGGSSEADALNIRPDSVESGAPL